MPSDKPEVIKKQSKKIKIDMEDSYVSCTG